MGWIHIYLQDIPHFDSLILPNTLLCSFPLVFCFVWQRFLLFVSIEQVAGVLICICIFLSSVLVLLEIMKKLEILENFLKKMSWGDAQ